MPLFDKSAVYIDAALFFTLFFEEACLLVCINRRCTFYLFA